MSRFHSAPAWIACLSLAGPAAATPCAPAFERLRFTARKALVLSGEVEIEASVRSAAAAAEELRDCPDDTACRAGDCVLLLDATTDAAMNHSQELTWLDADRGSVLQVLTARRGHRWRLTRQTENGQHEWTRRPADRRERKGSVDDWSRRSDEHVPWSEPAGERPRTSSFALLHQAMSGRLDREGASADYLVLAKDRLIRVELRARELVEVDVDYELGPPGEASRVKGPRLLRRVEVGGDALDSDEDESPVGLLGMSSGVELYLEPGNGLPVEVRGRVKPLGELRVRLAEARLPAPTSAASR